MHRGSKKVSRSRKRPTSSRASALRAKQALHDQLCFPTLVVPDEDNTPITSLSLDNHIMKDTIHHQTEQVILDSVSMQQEERLHFLFKLLEKEYSEKTTLLTEKFYLTEMVVKRPQTIQQKPQDKIEDVIIDEDEDIFTRTPSKPSLMPSPIATRDLLEPGGLDDHHELAEMPCIMLLEPTTDKTHEMSCDDILLSPPAKCQDMTTPKRALLSQPLEVHYNASPSMSDASSEYMDMDFSWLFDTPSKVQNSVDKRSTRQYQRRQQLEQVIERLTKQLGASLDLPNLHLGSFSGISNIGERKRRSVSTFALTLMVDNHGKHVEKQKSYTKTEFKYRGNLLSENVTLFCK